MLGAEVIQALVKRLPNAPGVYRMIDAAGDVLYVGKARSLKKRVTNYAHGRFHTQRIARMVRDTATMEFVVTRTETEALLLEANLIKRLRPRFNVLLRDDKSFPYILLTGDHPAPRHLSSTAARAPARATISAPSPRPARSAARSTRCSAPSCCAPAPTRVYESRTRPCLLYQIKRCSAPCTGEISARRTTPTWSTRRSDFLSGRSQKVKDEMSAADAGGLRRPRFRARRRSIATASRRCRTSQGHQGINPQTVDEADVFALHQEGGQTCVQVFFFRAGQNWGNRAYFPSADPALERRRGAGRVPRPVLRRQAGAAADPAVATTSRTRSCSPRRCPTRAGRKVEIARPQRGEKTRPGRARAAPTRARRWAASWPRARRRRSCWPGSPRPSAWTPPPRRIEVYDNSPHHGHQRGRRDDRRRAGRLREEPVPQVQHPLDRHHPRRRLRHDARGAAAPLLAAAQGARQADGAADEPTMPRTDPACPAWPDLVLIDGGQGQMAAVREVLADLGIDDMPRRRRRQGRRTATPAASASSSPGGKPVHAASARSRCSTSSSACATRPTASPSAPTARGARRRWQEPARRDRRHRARPQARAAACISAPPRRSAAPAIDDLRAVDGISESVARQIYNHFHESG